jgi:hypothetical protein
MTTDNLATQRRINDILNQQAELIDKRPVRSATRWDRFRVWVWRLFHRHREPVPTFGYQAYRTGDGVTTGAAAVAVDDVADSGNWQQMAAANWYNRYSETASSHESLPTRTHEGDVAGEIGIGLPPLPVGQNLTAVPSLEFPQAVDARIGAAIQAERARCAGIVDRATHGWDPTLSLIAAKIRSGD